jgi:hypothetical protein
MDLIHLLLWAPSYSRRGQIAHSQAVCSEALLRSISFLLHLSPACGSDAMAAPLRRVVPGLGRALLSPTPARMLSAEASDALVEIKPGEIGMVSGIPEEHLRRKVPFPRLPRLRRHRHRPVFSGSMRASLEMFGFQGFFL